MWYNFALNTFVFIYPKDKVLSELILKYTKLEIEKINYYSWSNYIDIYFHSGVRLLGLNVHKYYAWLSGGIIYNKHGVLYEWQDVRPSVKAMYYLDKAIKEFEESTTNKV